MQTARARLAGSAIVLATYYWTLFVSPAGGVDADELRLRNDIEASLRWFTAGRFADALGPTQRVSRQLPTQAIYHQRLALIFRQLERPADEVREWEAMKAASPTPIDGCPMIAEAYRRDQREDRALIAFEWCAGLKPSNPDFELFFGQALLRAGRNAEARAAFERGLALSPGYADLHLLLGIRQFAEGQLRSARSSFERFLVLAPDRRDEVAPWLDRTRPVK